jgi:hypothetical protein
MLFNKQSARHPMISLMPGMPCLWITQTVPQQVAPAAAHALQCCCMSIEFGLLQKPS